MAALQDISEPAQITDFVSNPNGRSLTCMGRSISEYLNDVETEFRNFHDALNSSGTPDVFDEGNPEIVDATISMLGKAQLLAAYALGPALTLKNDPLKNFLSEAWWGIPVIQVAAAGNMECNYPFAPALWDGVVSVSANSGESYVFNKGEIIPNGDIKEGTSLAAPMVSVEEAVYLATTSTANCNGMSPPLNDDVWDNTALANADSKCPGFVR
jgi:hypothetical protein